MTNVFGIVLKYITEQYRHSLQNSLVTKKGSLPEINELEWQDSLVEITTSVLPKHPLITSFPQAFWTPFSSTVRLANEFLSMLGQLVLTMASLETEIQKHIILHDLTDITKT